MVIYFWKEEAFRVTVLLLLINEPARYDIERCAMFAYKRAAFQITFGYHEGIPKIVELQLEWIATAKAPLK